MGVQGRPQAIKAVFRQYPAGPAVDRDFDDAYLHTISLFAAYDGNVKRSSLLSFTVHMIESISMTSESGCELKSPASMTGASSSPIAY